MQRYFLNRLIDDKIILTSDQDIFKHFGKVMRARIGSKAEFVDSNQSVFVGEVDSVSNDIISIKVVSKINTNSELPIEVTIVVSPLKNDRSDWLIQKATELGVNHIIMADMKRTVVDWHKQLAKKQARFEKIAKSAAEQSHRLMIPSIEFVNWQTVCNMKKDTGIVAWEESAKAGEKLAFVTQITDQDLKHLVLVFGPEGGLTTEELEILESNGYIAAGLGPRILRAETAPLYALSAISTLCELS
ncbi:RsmE family RNA methyltransferase [Leuconostoc palmae]|uniref:RsmE family RNA methyltransferase n=1 Tax=Leuconostoc palmae TaxID=501487 RepID=UPI001C7D0460|nr:RsmE family RNA methyltransferase [Leuconostoc palmae]